MCAVAGGEMLSRTVLKYTSGSLWYTSGGRGRQRRAVAGCEGAGMDPESPCAIGALPAVTTCTDAEAKRRWASLLDLVAPSWVEFGWGMGVI